MDKLINLSCLALVVGEKFILIVDNEQEWRDWIYSELDNIGFDMVLFANGDDVRRKLFSNDLVLVIMENNIPPERGIELLEELREKKISVPVIMFTKYTAIKSRLQELKGMLVEKTSKEKLIPQVKQILRGFKS